MQGNMVQTTAQEESIDVPFYGSIQTQLGKGFLCAAHYHSYIEVLYGLAGRFVAYLDGEEFTFGPGDMVLICAGQVHYTYGLDVENSYIVLKFDPVMLYSTPRTFLEAKYVLPFIVKQSPPQTVFTAQALADSGVREIFFEIERECRAAAYGYDLVVHSAICRLFAWILRYYEKTGADLKANCVLRESDYRKLQKVFGFVAENYQNTISVEDAARVCNMSYSYFSRMFKATTRQNFSEYLASVRITHAEMLLTTSDLNITEIAQETGFSTSSYFIKQFKHYKNMTPKEFRTRYLTYLSNK